MKTKAMLMNDLEFGHIKDIVRQRIEMSATPLASDIYVYPDYLCCGWHAVFATMEEDTKNARVVVIWCKWGKLEYTYHELHGFLPSGALIVK